jgi:hypothetical protein
LDAAEEELRLRDLAKAEAEHAQVSVEATAQATVTSPTTTHLET